MEVIDGADDIFDDTPGSSPLKTHFMSPWKTIFKDFWLNIQCTFSITT